MCSDILCVFHFFRCCLGPTKPISLLAFPELENHYSCLYFCSFILLLQLSIKCYFKNEFVLRKYLFMVEVVLRREGLPPRPPAVLPCFTGALEVCSLPLQMVCVYRCTGRGFPLACPSTHHYQAHTSPSCKDCLALLSVGIPHTRIDSAPKPMALRLLQLCRSK